MAITLLPQAYAVEVPTLYTAQVAYDEDARNPRDDAYAAALRVVLARVSGSELSQNDAAVADLFPTPGAYVTRFSPGEEETLWVSFDGDAIEAVLKRAGQTVWGGDRPLTLVWLAVDWGQGDREIIAADDPERLQQQSRSIDRNRLLRERVLEIAEQRGLPVAFPLLDTTDLQGVTFSDIWGGFDERVLAASERYEARSILVGRIRPQSSQSNRWSYFFGSDERSWSGPPETVVLRIADMLAAEFAVGGNAPRERLMVTVSGIDSADAYGSVQGMLASVNLIEGFRIVNVSGDSVQYDVDIRGGADRLRRALRFAGLLEQQDDLSDTPATGTLQFFYDH